MGEAKLKRLVAEEMLLSCGGVQTAGGRDPGDLTTIDDPSTLEQIKNALAN